MYSLRINERTKKLIEEVSGITGLTVSSIMRKVRTKMDKGRIRPADGKEYAVFQRNGNVINYKVTEIYHNNLSDWITADMEPVSGHDINRFRSCLVAACLDAKEQNAAKTQKKKELDELYKNYHSQMIAERRALYAEVM